ncbi:MAG: uracil-DNA glycosylase family protein [Microgenomates group bacterium]
MRSVEIPDCLRCQGAEHPNWGIEGEAKRKTIMVVLECSDFRAIGIDYEKGLFESRTGQVLKNIIGDRFEQTIITNAAKCLFDGGKRKPNTREFSMCAINILDQIKNIQPEIVLCLGEKAAEAVTGMKFADVLGRVIGNVVVAHHPRMMTIEEKIVLAEIVNLAIPVQTPVKSPFVCRRDGLET